MNICLAESELDSIFHAVGGGYFVDGDAEFDNRLGYGGRNTRNNGLAAHKSGGFRHFDKMVGDCSIYDRNAANIENKNSGLCSRNLGEHSRHNVFGAGRIDDTDEGKE